MRAGRRDAELVVDRPVGDVGAARVVRAVLVDHRDLQPVGVGLARARDVDVDAVLLAVAVGVEVDLDPQLVVDLVRRAVAKTACAMPLTNVGTAGAGAPRRAATPGNVARPSAARRRRGGARPHDGRHGRDRARCRETPTALHSCPTPLVEPCLKRSVVRGSRVRQRESGVSGRGRCLHARP